MQIITDSAADLSPAEIEALNIHVVPLYIQFPEGEVAASDITPDEFYNRLRAMVPQVPTTAQPSIGMFLDLYNNLVARGETPLSIHVSSGLSGTATTAAAAAQKITAGKVHVIDTLTLSCGERFQVIAAAMALKAGWDIDRIRARLTQIRENTDVTYTLDTLDYLARGGRIGRVQALAGSLLNIKPIITVEKADGKYSTLSRGRTINQAINNIATHFADIYGSEKPVWVTVMHGQFAEKADLLAEAIKTKLNVAHLELRRISPVLGVHTGPGIVGAGVLPMELVSDLGELPTL